MLWSALMTKCRVPPNMVIQVTFFDGLSVSVLQECVDSLIAPWPTAAVTRLFIIRLTYGTTIKWAENDDNGSSSKKKTITKKRTQSAVFSFAADVVIIDDCMPSHCKQVQWHQLVLVLVVLLVKVTISFAAAALLLINFANVAHLIIILIFCLFFFSSLSVLFHFFFFTKINAAIHWPHFKKVK